MNVDRRTSRGDAVGNHEESARTGLGRARHREVCRRGLATRHRHRVETGGSLIEDVTRRRVDDLHDRKVGVGLPVVAIGSTVRQPIELRAVECR